MNNDFLEKQKQDIHNRLESEEDRDLKKKISVIYDFVSSLLEPDNYTDSQKEDLRKLALELGYKENTVFDEWISNIDRSKTTYDALNKNC